MPPPGYWARRAAGKNPKDIPALPLRLPGQEDHVSIGANAHYRAYRSEEDLSEALIEPTFKDLEEDLVAEAIGRLGKVRFISDLANPHPGLRAVLDSEERIREKSKQPYSSYYKPHFDAPHFQRQMRLINSLLLAFDRIGCGGHLYVEDEWLKGIGTLHTLKTVLAIGSMAIAIEFLEPSSPKGTKSSGRVVATTIRAKSWHADMPPCDWSDAPGNMLEKQLTQIAHALLGRAEKLLRLAAANEYLRRVERRRDMVREIEAKKAELERRRLEEIELHHKACRQSLIELSRDFQEASNIRGMVAALRLHPENTGSTQEVFEQWAKKALTIADSIDPTSKPLTEVVK